MSADDLRAALALINKMAAAMDAVAELGDEEAAFKAGGLLIAATIVDAVIHDRYPRNL